MAINASTACARNPACAASVVAIDRGTTAIDLAGCVDGGEDCAVAVAEIGVGKIVEVGGKLFLRVAGGLYEVERAAGGGYKAAGANTATISSPLPDGQPGAIWRGFGEPNARQQGLLDQLQSPGDTIIIPKNGISQQDLAALTAATGDEFAVFTTGGRRMIVRGGSNSFDGIIDESWASARAAEGWRFSAHTHPVPQGVEPGAVLRSSAGDQAILLLFPNNQSAIINSIGGRSLFTPNGDSLLGWLPN